MAEEYKDNTYIPKPNRFLVEEQGLNLSEESQPGSTWSSGSGNLVIEKYSEVPVANTNENKDLIIDNEELMEKFRQLFPDLGVDVENIGTIVKEYSYLKSTVEQLQDKIALGVSEGYEAEILGVGGLDGFYTRIDRMSSEINILKNNIKLAVNSTDYDSLETYVSSTMGGFADTFRNNVTTIAEQLTKTTSEINILRSKIELKVGEVNAEGVYTNANNEDGTSSWSNTVGVYDASLQNFEYTDATGWTGTGIPEDPYGLRFNGNQYLAVNNQMKDDTIYDQSFTIEAFLSMGNAYNQRLVNLGYSTQLSNAIGIPEFKMNLGMNEISYTPEYAFPVNSLIHVAYVFDAQLRVIEIYLNGELHAGEKIWRSDESGPMPATLLIGEGFVGDLYTFRVYDRRLNLDEISGNYMDSVTGNAYNRDGLIINLEGRKALSLAKAIDDSRSEIKILKTSITSTVTRTEMENAIATSSGHVIMFSNENQTFATESDGSLAEGIVIETDIDVFKGATRIGAIISSPILKNHLGIAMEYGTIEVTNPTAILAGHFRWTIPTGTNIPADYGWIELNFDMNGVTLLKKITWSKAKRGATGPEAPANYRLEVLSSNGNIFMNRQISTLLYVNIFYGDEDVTDQIEESRCIWTRTSENADSDLLWNAAHSVGAKHIYVDVNDIYDKATFTCGLVLA